MMIVYRVLVNYQILHIQSTGNSNHALADIEYGVRERTFKISIENDVLKAQYQYFKNIFRLVIQFVNRLDRLATWTEKVHCEARSMTTLCMYTKSVYTQ